MKTSICCRAVSSVQHVELLAGMMPMLKLLSNERAVFLIHGDKIMDWSHGRHFDIATKLTCINDSLTVHSLLLLLGHLMELGRRYCSYVRLRFSCFDGSKYLQCNQSTY